jgi:hypothetical protein
LQEIAVRAIEDGGVLVLPQVGFVLSERERRFLSPEWSDGRAKNISLDGTLLKGARGSAEDLAEMTAMVARFAQNAADLVATLFPRYAPYVQRARTSFRPQPAVGRNVSWRKDDSRLHVDAFPSRPNHGERILRVFSNINPAADRVWRVGEPFEAVARTFCRESGTRSRVGGPCLRRSRSQAPRSAYDHLMLAARSRKEDLAYQRDCDQQVVRFAPGTTWLCFSDQVMHALCRVNNAGADDPPPARCAIRRVQRTARYPGTPDRAHAGRRPVESLLEPTRPSGRVRA